ncbi:MAG: O-antigen ligase family protein [Candidatus Cloacimonetes bacterium]|jgi:putative inorganic carbon (hco3(-)) transporter|nr:O-antigen ligase family protein [Candidatus Cloacimonadota bacterium]MBT4333076.1 O-antigen ligase family protein [Candidatus Cloacimonadota bacterium]
MNYLAKSNRAYNLLSFFLVMLILMLSVFIADSLQTINVSSIVKLLVIITIFTIYFIFNEITIIGLLIPFTAIYLRPAKYLYYIMISILLLVFIAKRIYNKNYKVCLPYFYLFTLIAFFGIIATYRASVLYEGLHNLFTIVITPMILIFVIYNSQFSYTKMIKYMRYLVYVASLVGFLGVIIAITNPTERIGSTWETAMTINAFYVFSFFISLGLAFREKSMIQKYFFYFLSLIILFGMLFTYTRIALLSVFFGAILLAIRLKEVRKFAIVVLLLVMLFIPASMVERAGKNIFEDSSVIIRLFAWVHSFELIKQNPIFGIGFDTWKNTYEYEVPLYWLYAEHPHNVFIKLLLELGMIGMTAYFFIVFNIIWRFYKLIRKSKNIEFHLSMIVAIIAILFSCLTDVFIVKLPIAIIFWIMLAFMLKMTASKDLEVNYEKSPVSNN